MLTRLSSVAALERQFAGPPPAPRYDPESGIWWTPPGALELLRRAVEEGDEEAGRAFDRWEAQYPDHAEFWDALTRAATAALRAALAAGRSPEQAASAWLASIVRDWPADEKDYRAEHRRHVANVAETARWLAANPDAWPLPDRMA
jgi:hypothetical protein